MIITPPKYISVNQPVGTFYIASLPATTLISIVDILSRDMTEEGRQRIQREYSVDRGREIAKYAQEDHATFPTSIIVAAYPDRVRIDEANGTLLFGHYDSEGNWQEINESIPQKIGEVIDGQHRLLGLKAAIEENNQPSLLTFELPVVFMLDLDQGDKAYIFSIINSKQRSVSSSLIMDLFGLQMGRSPYKTCHEIAQTFYDWIDIQDNEEKRPGPFYKRLKMLGKKVGDEEMLSQGSFGKYILKLISRTPDKDAKEFRLNGDEAKLQDDPKCKLRYLFIEKKDHVIARILHEYFSAIRKAFPKEWDEYPEKYLLRKTVGFSALIQAFDSIWDREKINNYDQASLFFAEKAAEFKNNLSGIEITSDQFPSSEKGAQMMAKRMLNGQN